MEVVAALRALERRQALDPARAHEALADFLDLPLVRHGHAGLLDRAFALRNNFSAYDAMYVALAEGLAAALLTADRRLEAAVARHTDVELGG